MPRIDEEKHDEFGTPQRILNQMPSEVAETYKTLREAVASGELVSFYYDDNGDRVYSNGRVESGGPWLHKFLEKLRRRYDRTLFGSFIGFPNKRGRKW